MRNELLPLRQTVKEHAEDIYFQSDKNLINGWYSAPSGKKPTIVYCPGQGENITMWQEIFMEAHFMGYGILMFDYRGHGKSTGNPSEDGLYQDTLSSIKFLKQFKATEEKDIILWGRSLGGAVAAQTARRIQVKALIIESSFINLEEIAKHLVNTKFFEKRVGLLAPIVKYLIKKVKLADRFSVEHSLKEIDAPVLMVHSSWDTTTPIEMAYTLSKIRPNIELKAISKGSHHSSEWAFQPIFEFLDRLC